jgi:formylglycine-generating enzyme required for sulfatase activity
VASLNMPQLKMSHLMDGLYHVAFEAHTGQGREEGAADIAEEVLLKQLKPYLGDDWNRAEAFVQYVRERAGLLIRHKTDAYTFPHRTFQEFMAACHLTGLKDYPREAACLVRENADLWRVVFVLAAGHAGRTQLGNAISAAGKLCLQDVSAVESIDAAVFNRAVIAGEALLEIGLAAVRREEEGRILLDRVRDWLVAAIAANDVLDVRQRVEAGNVLARIGDPRFDPENWYLPHDEDLGFVAIPGGSFFMGEFKKRHEVVLSTYAMARYPVTVAQYKAFVAETGYELDEKWERYNRLDNHPVVVVSWNDAKAYCRWLTEKLKERGLRVTLPTEAQWERAARGTDERKYPWSDETIDPEKANYNKSGISSTSPVGCFPKGVSTDGLFDLAGNVSEWCHDWYGEYPREKGPDPTGPSDGTSRVLRGGAWSGVADLCRTAYRLGGVPDSRFRNFGFRLVCLPGQPGEPSQ